MQSRFAKIAAVAAITCAGFAASANAGQNCHHGKYYHDTAAYSDHRGGGSYAKTTTGDVWSGFLRAPLELGRGVAMLPGRVLGTVVHAPMTTWQVVRGERRLFTPAPESEKGQLTLRDVGSRGNRSVVGAPATTRDYITGKRTLFSGTQRAAHYEPPV